MTVHLASMRRGALFEKLEVLKVKKGIIDFSFLLNHLFSFILVHLFLTSSNRTSRLNSTLIMLALQIVPLLALATLVTASSPSSPQKLKVVKVISQKQVAQKVPIVGELKHKMQKLS